jgi:ATP-dependent RNA helicase RhlE
MDMTFKELGLVDPILKAISENGYNNPTPIQEQAIPYILAKRDLLGCAQTGTGKTAAFALPLIQSLLDNENSNSTQKRIKVLILTPTRELAIQIRDNFRAYGVHTNLKCSVILGGVNQNSQIEVLRKGVDILVATPGRLLDLINQKHVNLTDLKTLVLDEADTMLDMGFIKDVRKIMAFLPEKRQTLLFSATMPKEINDLALTILKNHATVKVNPVASTVLKINQLLYYVDRGNKTPLLIKIIKETNMNSAIIFTRTKHGANKLSEVLAKDGIISEVIHGNKSQNARVKALTNFKTGKSKFLIATDIAAHGIDVSGLEYVINFEIPNLPETYVHRIGRTARAGLSGTAISLCDSGEQAYVKDIQRLIKQEIEVINDHGFPMVKHELPEKTRNNNSKPHFKSVNTSNRKTSRPKENTKPRFKEFSRDNRSSSYKKNNKRGMKRY